MEKMKWMSVVLASALVLSACGEETGSSSSGEAEAGGEAKNFRASSGVPDKHFWHRGFFEPLTTAVEEESGGQATFDIFTSGELVTLGGELDALNSGQIDIALTLMPPYDPQRFPYTEVVMLPTLTSDAGIATEAMAKMMESDREIADGKTYYQLEFEDKDLVAFANPATEPYVLSTTNQKFESAADFTAALRVRTASRVHEILANELGITGQSMPISDAYDALSRNALDGIIYNAPDWIAFGLDELIKHTITGVNLGHFVGHTAMTQETWDSLSPETQEVFRENAESIVHEGAALTMGETEENIASNKEKGGEITHFDDVTPEVHDLLESAVVNSWNDWIEDLDSQGLGGKEMAILWRDMLVESGAVLPQDILDLE
ncbi:TRAP transporter substrate-binding protein [Planococcus sp. SE5232]|uniref:TRAP transporter substrate-binding protein n=1 Tax=unclassified Planococcus (in: firmicutes) TaxID=2662419 RepID=UPI001CBEA013|nr:TRAP transporter substrate-binding protein DctP [Planococcus sp. 4-30]